MKLCESVLNSVINDKRIVDLDDLDPNEADDAFKVIDTLGKTIPMEFRNLSKTLNAHLHNKKVTKDDISKIDKLLSEVTKLHRHIEEGLIKVGRRKS